MVSIQPFQFPADELPPRRRVVTVGNVAEVSVPTVPPFQDAATSFAANASDNLLAVLIVAVPASIAACDTPPSTIVPVGFAGASTLSVIRSFSVASSI